MLYKLQKLRKEKGYTCEEMASMLGISKVFYWQIENGKRRLLYEQAFKIATVFKLKPDDIFLDDIKNLRHLSK